MTTAIRDNESLHWQPAVHIDKYSDDQTAWANEHLGRYFLPRTIARGVSPKYRNCLRLALERTGSPELGYAGSTGNLLVTVGLDAITKLLTAIGGAQAFSGPTRAIVGVGATATAATIADTALGADAGSAFYQGCDSSNPTQANGVITTVCTFTTGNANFAWAEWCWATCTGAITPGATLASVATGTKLWNHKIQSLGTKVSGSWILTATVTIS